MTVSQSRHLSLIYPVLSCFCLEEEVMPFLILWSFPEPDSSICIVSFLFAVDSRLILCVSRARRRGTSLIMKVTGRPAQNDLHLPFISTWSFWVLLITSVLFFPVFDGEVPLHPPGVGRALGSTQESSPTPQFKSIHSLALSFLYSPNLTSIHWQSNVSAF